MAATPTWDVFASNPSESAALQGHKAKTPIIAGVTAGTCVLLAWIIGFVIYIVRRRRRDAEARAAGLRNHRDLEKPVDTVHFVIPPDPAIVQGLRKPGEPAFVDRDPPKMPSRAQSYPAPRSSSESRAASPVRRASSPLHKDSALTSPLAVTDPQLPQASASHSAS